MIKKINKKGFTLVELLATIAILGILAAVTIVTVTKYLQKSKEKAEDAFEKQLSNAIDDYISLYGSKLEYDLTTATAKQKCYDDSNIEVCDTVDQYQAKEEAVNLENIINITVSKDIINPTTKVKCTNTNTTLTIYRDSDFVYCFTIEPKTNSCISEKINTCTMYK